MKLLKKLYSPNAIIITLGIIVIYLLAFTIKQRDDLKLARTHVQVKEVIREVKGPVRIKYRKIKEASKPEIKIVTVEKIVYKEAEPKADEDETEGPDNQTPERTDRYVVGVSLLGVNSRRFGHAFHAGYSIGNRLDILGGVSSQADKKYSLQTNYRF